MKYSGVLAPASAWRSRIAPPKDAALETAANENANDDDKPRRRGYRPWAELLKRTFAVDVLACPKCTGRMTLLGDVRHGALREVWGPKSTMPGPRERVDAQVRNRGLQIRKGGVG